MPRYNVTVWASYEIEIDAPTQEDAEEIAFEESSFPYYDHCETDLLEED